jgi:hypothetical protein
MRMPRVRFAMKRMMLAMAALALIMGGLRIAWLRDGYRKAAAFHAATENLQRVFLEGAKTEEELALAFGYELPGEEKAQQAAKIQIMQRKADNFAAMRRKYERAAARPWMAVDPDPPSPQP